MAKNPLFFLVGCSRSGTTLVQHMMDAHEQLAVVPETRWFVHWFDKRYGISEDGFVTPDLVPRLLQRHRLFRDADIGVTQQQLEHLVSDGGKMRYQDFVSILFDRYAEARGVAHAGNKTPGYVRSLQTIHLLWPAAKLIHVIRDGREVSLSIIQKRTMRNRPGKPGGRFATWQEDAVTTSALWWEWNVRLGQEAGRAIGPGHYYELRYDALVARPEAESRALCDFLGVPFDDAMLRHHEGRVKADPRLVEKHTGLDKPVTAGMRNWNTEMPRDDIERFEASAGGLLEELGYEFGVQNHSPESLAHAARLRGLFMGRPLPENWRAWNGTRGSVEAHADHVGN